MLDWLEPDRRTQRWYIATACGRYTVSAARVAGGLRYLAWHRGERGAVMIIGGAFDNGADARACAEGHAKARDEAAA